MGGKTMVIAPASVPGAQVSRVQRGELARPTPVTASPRPVPSPELVRIFRGHFTAAQVEQLRDENRALRRELARLRAT